MKGFLCYRLLLIAPGCLLQAASRKLREFSATASGVSARGSFPPLNYTPHFLS